MTGAQLLQQAVIGLSYGGARHLERVVADLIVREALSGRPVRWARLGTFLARTRVARRIRNPATKRLMRLPAVVSVGLRASKYARRAR